MDLAHLTRERNTLELPFRQMKRIDPPVNHIVVDLFDTWTRQQRFPYAPPGVNR